MKLAPHLNDIWVSGWRRRGRGLDGGEPQKPMRTSRWAWQERDRRCMRVPTWDNVTDERWHCDHDSFYKEREGEREEGGVTKTTKKWTCALKKQASQIGSALVPGEKGNQRRHLGVSALNPVAKIVSSDKAVNVFVWMVLGSATWEEGHRRGVEEARS